MSRTTRLWLLVVPVALAFGAATAALILVSDHADVPRLQAVLTLLTGGSFILAGLIARTRRPLNPIGLLLIAVGLTWLVSAALFASNASLPWTLGLATMSIPAAFLIHLLLAYPSGRLASLRDRALVVAAYVLVVVGELLILLFEPDPRACDDCPANAFLISDQETAAQIMSIAVTFVAVAYLLAVVATIVRRWRDSSPARRRVLTPVLLTGGATMLLFAISVGAYTISRPVSNVAGWTATVVLIAVPFVFLAGLLKSRLARADISRALAEEPRGGAQARVRELLHDPTAELLYASGEPASYIDADGRPREAAAEPGRAVTFVEREGRSLAAIAHDEALLDEPELLEQVGATVGLEIERDQNLFALQASERRSRALVEAIPDNMFRISADGTFLDIQESPGGTTRVEAEVGSSVYDYPVPRELIDRVMATGHRVLETGELQTIEWELRGDGDLHFQEGRFLPSGEHEFFVVVRDVTDRKRQEMQQAALHRVALAVASEARPEHIFHLVSAEVGRLLGAHGVKLLRYEPDGERCVLVGHWTEQGVEENPVPAHDPMPMAGNPIHLVYETGRPIRVDLKQPMRPELAARLRKHRVNSMVAAPITVSGRLWGVVAATLQPPQYFWRGAEKRLGAFTQLVSLALANQEARGQLEASRARLVTAGDEERRRLERNLHDGAQQRLVSLSLSLRLAQSKLGSDPEAARELLSSAGDELGVALEELRELARGIHPAVLTERGLGPALQSLCDRAPLPVDLESLPDDRLPRGVEAAAYYVVSEALANVAKYAHAASATVSIVQENGAAVVEVADDGIGGADPDVGSGLRGLTDRVEALDGRLHVVSPPGGGTRVRAEIPCGSPRAEMSKTPI
jgi:signal transduction histidine kinase/PAS domain-containing protein